MPTIALAALAVVATLMEWANASLGYPYDGATDDFGYRSVTNRTKYSDYHATVLHQLGFDHKELVYEHNGRDERLTDVYDAHVIHDLIS